MKKVNVVLSGLLVGLISLSGCSDSSGCNNEDEVVEAYVDKFVEDTLKQTSFGRPISDKSINDMKSMMSINDYKLVDVKTLGNSDGALKCEAGLEISNAALPNISATSNLKYSIKSEKIIMEEIGSPRY